jgi:DNA repair photolyase
MIYICRNAIDLLGEEIKEVPKGRVIIGSVHDPYQPLEESYKLVRKVIKILVKNGFFVHILTKSPLVLRDIDLIGNSQKNLVTISLISLNKHINCLFESDAPAVDERLDTVKKLVSAGVSAGVAIFPIIPLIVDDELGTLVKKIKDHGAQFIVFKHLELKGRQKQDMFQFIHQHFPNIYVDFRELYGDRFYPSSEYTKELEKKISKLSRKSGLSCGIPFKLDC